MSLGGSELPPVVAYFEGDDSDIEATIERIERRLADLSQMEARPEAVLDTEEFQQQVTFVEDWMAELSSLVADPDVEIPVAKVEGQIELIEAMLADLEGMSVRIPVGFAEAEGSLGLLDQAMRNLGQDADSTFGSLGQVVSQIDQMTSAARAADAQVTDLRLSWASLLAQAGSTNAENALRNLAASGGSPTSDVAQMLASSRTSQGAADVAALYGLTTGGDKGGGGGRGGLMSALGFGAGAFGLAQFGSLGSLAGFGLESMLTTGAGILGSGLGAMAGAGALGLGTLGVAGVGMGTDMAGIGQAIGDTQKYNQALDNLNKAIAEYGAGSTQAQHAQNLLNYTLAGFPAIAQPAIVALSSTTQQFKALFDQATGPAEAKGAQILQSLVQTGESFLPTIGKFASENMTIIMASLLPLETWIKGPGLEVFTQLEQTFQGQLPTAMHAFTQGIELLIRTLGFLAPYTGGLITSLDHILTNLNGPGWDRYTGAISRAIDVFKVWWDLIKNVGDALYLLFHNDAQTGTDLVQTLSNMVERFNDWASTVSGGDQLHQLLESHKNELLAIVGMLGQMASAWGQLELVARPVIMDIVTGITTVVNFLSQIPGVGQLMGLVLAFEILGSRIGPLNGLLNAFHGLIKNLAQEGLVLLGGALSSLGGPFATLGGWLTNLGTTGPTEIERLTASIEGLTAALSGADGAAAGLAATMETVGASGAAAGGAAAGAGGVAAGAGAGGVAAGGGAAAIGGTASAVLSAPAAAGIPSLAATALLLGLPLYGVSHPLTLTPQQKAAGDVVAQNETNILGPVYGRGSPGIVRPFSGEGAPAPPPVPAMQTDYGASNIEALSHATGLADGYVKALAQDLKVNLGQALSPQQIQEFTQYVKDNGGAASITGMLWTQAHQQVMAAMTGMAAHAHQAMPQVSQAVANMVQSTQPHLVALVSQLQTHGHQAAAGFIAQFLSQLSPAEMASKEMHDKIHSPLVPLVNELQALGMTGAAHLVQAFIDKQASAGTASQGMHDKFKNPIYQLQTELASSGDIMAAQLVQNFAKHNPDAATKAGLMKDAIAGKLNPLEDALKAVGDTSGANLVAALIAHASSGNWDGFGQSVDSGVANGITKYAGIAINAAQGMVQAVITASHGTVKAASPSLVFMDLGRNIAEGLAIGITAHSHLPKDAATQMLSGTLSPVGGAAGGGGGSGPLVHIGSITVGAGASPEAVGAEVAAQVRVAQLRKARFQGATGGVYGRYAGSR